MAASLYFYISAAREVWPTVWFLLPSICAIEMCVVSAWFCAQMGVPKKYSVLLTLGNLMLIWVFFVTVKKILWKDALQWRGTTYHAGRYEPTSWTRWRPRLLPVRPAAVIGEASWRGKISLHTRFSDL
ncbi:MAG: hypothetical protein ACLP5H_15445 [Desulfomonilaceae bacterium]